MAERYVDIIDTRHSETTPGPDSKYILVDQNRTLVGIPRPKKTRTQKRLACLEAGQAYTFHQTTPTLEPVINPAPGKINFIPGKQPVSFTGKLVQIHDARLTTKDGDSIFIAELNMRKGIAFFAFALNHFTASTCHKR